MYWKDEGYLLTKNSLNENSIIIDAFTLEHGRHSGVVYGGSSRKQKKNFQIGNKILLNWNSKGENKIGYFSIELIKPIIPHFFDNKKKSICMLSACSILKILLPERQINKKIFYEFENFISNLNKENWIESYIFWEFSLIKELGYEVDFNKDRAVIEVNNKPLKIPDLLRNIKIDMKKKYINEALFFNKNLLMENFITPNKLKFPNSRNILERYFNNS
tara:strand:- start:1773 stop:2426 length:654 start_codon:yes stop_codon:yes gene_type:complete